MGNLQGSIVTQILLDWLRVWFCLMIILSSRSGIAEEDPTDRLLNQASSLYGQLKFEASLLLTDNVIERPRNTREQLIRLYHIRGLCQASLRNYDQAQEEFARLLTLDPRFRLSNKIAPRIRAPFEKAKRKDPVGLKIKILPLARIATPGKSLGFSIEVISNPFNMAESVQIWYRHGHLGKFSSIHSPILGLGQKKLTISSTAWESQSGHKQLFWFAAIEGKNKAQLANLGNVSQPRRIKVDYSKPLAPMTVVDTPAGRDGEEYSHWYKQWWVWAIVGGVLVGIVTAGIVKGSESSSSPGPYDFSIDVFYSEK